MNPTLLLPAAYLADRLAGDPEWFPHPVRLIGSVIARGESILRRPGQSRACELIAGNGLTVAVVASSYCIPAFLLRSARRRSPLLADSAELLLAWTCLAAHNLDQEATAVTHALHAGDLPLARKRLARIVGRDTATLDASEIARAIIETVAESASDGILAPILYMALGGVPLAMAYKAVNTLDSMIGHTDTRYFHFGKSAARLDDAANFLPSRVSALSIVAASTILPHADSKAAWRTWVRDGSKHKSPNAGQPESAMAGALHVALGGGNTYAGELIPAPRIADEFPQPTPQHATQSIRVVSIASLIGLGAGVLLACLMQARRRA